MSPVFILTLGNWQSMFRVSLQFQPRYLPIFVLLCKEAHHLLPRHSCFCEKLLTWA